MSFSRGSRLRRGGEREFCPVIVLSIFWKRFKYRRRGGGSGGRAREFDRADHREPSVMGNGREGAHPGHAAVPVEKSRHREHPAGFPRGDLGALLTREEPEGRGEIHRIQVRETRASAQKRRRRTESERFALTRWSAITRATRGFNETHWDNAFHTDAMFTPSARAGS